MDPQGPSQPPLDTVYNTAGNPADQNPQEQRTASVNENSNVGSLVEAREQGDVPVPSNHDQAATSTSLGYGARDSSGDKGSSVSSVKTPLPHATCLELAAGAIYNAVSQQILIPRVDITRR